MVTEGLSPAIRLAFCCHLLGNKRLLVFMKVRHLLCRLEFVPKVFGKPNFVIGTQKSHSSPKVWVWCWIMTEMTLVIDRGKLIDKTSPVSGRVVILSDSVFASSFKRLFKAGVGSWTVWCSEDEWRVLFILLVTGYLEAWWPCSSSGCPSTHGLDFLLVCWYS